MDLKSMLNGPTAAKATSAPAFEQQSFQRPSRVDAPLISHEHSYRERPSPYGPPLATDQRSPGYVQLQSPYQSNSAVTATPSSGTRSFHSQSPVAHSQINTPRDGYAPHQQYGMPPQPQTPGGQYFHPSMSAHAPGPSTASFNHSQSSREQSIPINGTPRSHSRQMSPGAQYPSQPATPLGPPAPFPKPLSQNQRSPSQGQEHYRRYSSGSVNSLHHREIDHSSMPSPEQLRRESLQRLSSIDRERERSISVSPKTIPRPSPLRQPSIESHLQAQLTPPVSYPLENGQMNTPQGAIMSVETHQQTPPPSSSHIQSKEHHTNSQASSARPSPGPAIGQMSTPKSADASLPPKPPTSQHQEQPSLKRTASVLSGVSSSSQPSRKRSRREETPIFARSARPNNPPRLTRRSNGGLLARVQQIPPSDIDTSRIDRPSEPPPALQSTPLWEPSIINVTPYEDLTRRVSDWIFHTIGNAAQPTGGAVFEIEAKIGEIFDVERGARVDLPVDTETIFNKNKFTRTKFESSMNMAQHQQLNEFLNQQVQVSMAAAQTSNRQPIVFDHPKEFDEFFELRPEGMANLPAAVLDWRNQQHKIKVRRTLDLKTGATKAQIIKARIADMDIYNPGSDFDYRISISIECPWEGRPEWLDQTGEGGRDRNKDRMSYRHMAYQIDLTQVSYNTKADREHELEVEISTEQIRRELDNIKAQRPSRYEDLVRGLIDNVRILCRKGTVGRR